MTVRHERAESGYMRQGEEKPRCEQYNPRVQQLSRLSWTRTTRLKIQSLPAFRETEVESYFGAFKRLASALDWPRDVWEPWKKPWKLRFVVHL